MATTGRALVRRDKSGIEPGMAQQHVIEMGGPLTRRRSLTQEQRLQTPGSTPSQQQPGPPIIDLSPRPPTKPDVGGAQETDLHADEDEGKSGKQTTQEQEEGPMTRHKTQTRHQRTTRTSPQSDDAYDDAHDREKSYPSTRKTYVAPRSTREVPTAEPLQEPSRKQTQTREYPLSEPFLRRQDAVGLAKAGRLHKTRTGYSHQVQTAMHLDTRNLLLWVVVLTLVGVILFVVFILPWCVDRYNDIRYRSPRIDYIHAVLEINDSATQPSLITAINNDGHILVTVYPGNTKAAPVVYEFEAMTNSDNPGRYPATLAISRTHIIVVTYRNTSLDLAYTGKALQPITV